MASPHHPELYETDSLDLAAFIMAHDQHVLERWAEVKPGRHVFFLGGSHALAEKIALEFASSRFAKALSARLRLLSITKGK